MQLLHAHSTTVLAQARPTMFCIRLVRPDTDQRYLTHVTITYVRTYTPCTMERDYAWRLATWVVNAFRVSSLPVLQGQEIPFRLNFYLFFC